MNSQPLNLTALADPAHPQHHFSVGQIIGYALIGFTAYEQVATGGAGALLNIPSLLQLIQGLMSVATQPQAPPPVQP